MRKLLTGILAASGLAIMSSAGFACDVHGGKHVTASASQTDEGVAMSTYDGSVVPPLVEEVVSSPVGECADGSSDCTPKSE